MTPSRLHSFAGLAGFALFITTGIYMLVRFPELYAGRESVRFLFRSNHIYLLFASTVNIALGLGVVVSASPLRRRIQFCATGVVVIAPIILFAAFFVDPPNPDSGRTLSRIGVIFTVAGVIIHLLCTLRRDRPKKQPPVD